MEIFTLNFKYFVLDIFNCRRGFSDSGGGPPAKQRDLEGAVSRYVGKKACEGTLTCSVFWGSIYVFNEYCQRKNVQPAEKFFKRLNQNFEDMPWSKTSAF